MTALLLAVIVVLLVVMAYMAFRLSRVYGECAILGHTIADMLEAINEKRTDREVLSIAINGRRRIKDLRGEPWDS